MKIQNMVQAIIANSSKFASLLAPCFILAVVADSAFADTTLISNMPAQNTYSFTGVGNGTDTPYYAEGFTMSDTAYTFDSATLQLQCDGNVSPIIQLYSNNASDAPGMLLLTLTDPYIDNNDTNFLPITFTAPTTYTLEPNTTYWLTATSNNTNTFLWHGDNIQPTGIASYYGNYANFGTGDSSLITSYSIAGTQPVPEPHSALLFLAALFVFIGFVFPRFRRA